MKWRVDEVEGGSSGGWIKWKVDVVGGLTGGWMEWMDGVDGCGGWMEWRVDGVEGG